MPAGANEDMMADEVYALLCRLRERLPRRKETLEKHAAAVREIRAELAKVDCDFMAIVAWDNAEGNEVDVRIPMLPGGRAELGEVLDETLDEALAQGLEWIGSLVLRKRSHLQPVDGEPMSVLCGIELDHGKWRYHGGDKAKWVR